MTERDPPDTRADQAGPDQQEPERQEPDRQGPARRPASIAAAAEREARLAAALRENLRRRKAQSRARTAEEQPSPPVAPPEGTG